MPNMREYLGLLKIELENLIHNIESGSENTLEVSNSINEQSNAFDFTSSTRPKPSFEKGIPPFCFGTSAPPPLGSKVQFWIEPHLHPRTSHFGPRPPFAFESRPPFP